MSSFEHRRFLPHWSDSIIAFTKGTVSGVAIRGITWPIEHIFYQYADPKNQKTYVQLTQETFQIKSLPRLSEAFMKAGTLQTIGKAGANFGTINYVENMHPNLSPINKITMITIISTVLESLTTTSGEWNKVKYFLQSQGQTSLTKAELVNPLCIKTLSSPEFRRAFSSTFVRSLWSGGCLYGGIYGIEHWASPYLSDKMSPSSIKVASAVAGAVAVQWLIMPFVNYQTYTFQNASLSWQEALKKFLKTHQGTLTKGATGRAVHRAMAYGFGFLATEYMKETKREDSPSSSLSNSPSR